MLAVVLECWTSKRRTPLDFPIAGFCVMAAIGAAISPAPDVTVPKATGLVLGLASMRLTPLLFKTKAEVWRGGLLYVAAATLITLLGFAGTAWNLKAGTLNPLTTRLPRFIQVMPQQTGVNPNAEAAAVLCGFPLLTALCMGPSVMSRLRSRMLMAAWALQVGFLLLTHSRAAWISAWVTVFAIMWLARTRFALLAGAALVVGVLAAATWGSSTGSDESGVQVGLENSPADSLQSSVGPSLESRGELWARAFWALEDFPLTGVGLGAFRRVVPLLYPLYDQPDSIDIVHAHNQLLQVALDVGIPGLVCYLAVLLVSTVVCRRIYVAGDRRMKLLALGLGGNLLALQVFGLTDAVALGAKIGLFFWLTLGLLVASHRITSDQVAEGPLAARRT